MNDVPYFLETRVRQALARAQEIAVAKGLAHAFDAELFAADRAVRDLLRASGTRAAARHETGGTSESASAARGQLAKLDDLLAKLQAAPDRGRQGAGAPVGRAGRRTDGRR